MTNYCGTVLTALKKRRAIANISLISQSGSAPRTAGARMVVFSDGSFWGTIGGGKYEGMAVEEGLKLLAEKQKNTPSCLMYFSLNDVKDMDLVCGGNVLLLIEIIRPTQENIELFSRGASLEAEGKAFSFATKLDFPAPDDPTKFWKSEGTVERTFYLANDPASQGSSSIYPQQLHEAVTARKRGEKHPLLFTLTHKECPDSVWLIESFEAQYRVHIFGAGHVAKALAELLSFTGFSCFVLDDREEFASVKRFPHSRVCLQKSLSEHENDTYFIRNDIQECDAVVIVTRGHACDKEALASALKTQAGYIGMIGSAAKRLFVYSALKKSGVTENDLRRVYCPIGLSIGAETPEEIAVSITAQLIEWRAHRITVER